MGVLIVLLPFIGLRWAIDLIVISWALVVIGSWKIFKKSGEKPLKAIIPFYNKYTEARIAWTGSVYFKILAFELIAFLSIVISGKTAGLAQLAWIILCGLSLAMWLILEIKKCRRLAEAFDKRTPFAIGMVALPALFYMLLGFGADNYSRSLY